MGTWNDVEGVECEFRKEERDQYWECDIFWIDHDSGEEIVDTIDTSGVTRISGDTRLVDINMSPRYNDPYMNITFDDLTTCKQEQGASRRLQLRCN